MLARLFSIAVLPNIIGIGFEYGQKKRGIFEMLSLGSLLPTRTGHLGTRYYALCYSGRTSSLAGRKPLR